MFTDNGNGNRCKAMTTDPMTSGSCELNRSQKYNSINKQQQKNRRNQQYKYSQTWFSDHLYLVTVKPGLVTTSIKLQSTLV